MPNSSMKSIYQSKEWKSLNEYRRAGLLLVIEGLKSGTEMIVSKNQSGLLDILEETGLSYVVWSEFPNAPDDVSLLIARPNELNALRDKLSNLSRTDYYNNYEKAFGQFFGFPECCIEEFLGPRTKEEEQAKENGQFHLASKYGRELTEQIERDGDYPEVFDYLPGGFIPCSLYCDETTQMLSEWKEALEKYDPGAANALVRCNRWEYPQRLVHEAYLQKESKRLVEELNRKKRMGEFIEKIGEMLEERPQECSNYVDILRV